MAFVGRLVVVVRCCQTWNYNFGDHRLGPGITKAILHVFFSKTKEQSAMFFISCLKVVMAEWGAREYDEWQLFVDAAPHFKSTRLLGWFLLDAPPLVRRHTN